MPNKKKPDKLPDMIAMAAGLKPLPRATKSRKRKEPDTFESFERSVFGDTPKRGAKTAQPKLTFSQRQARSHVKMSIEHNVGPTAAFKQWKQAGGAIRKQAFFDLYAQIEQPQKLAALNAVNRAAKKKAVPIEAWAEYVRKSGNKIRSSTFNEMYQRAKVKPLKKYAEVREYHVENVRHDRRPNLSRLPDSGPMFSKDFYFVAELRCTNTETNKDFVRHITVSTNKLMTPDEVEAQAREAFYKNRKGTKATINSVVVIKARKAALPATV